MHVNKLTILFIAISIILGAGLVLSSIVPYFMNLVETEGARPRDGITLVHSKHIDVSSTQFYFVTTRNQDFIEVRFSTNPNDNNPRSAMVGIYFPYKVELNMTYNEKYTDFATWYKEEYGEHSTIFVKNYSCNNVNECDLWEDNQVQFILPLNLKFDSQNVYRHSIKVKFDSPGGKGLDVFGRFEDSHNLEYGFSNDTKGQATIIIDEKADNIHTLPIPEPGIFHNSYNDYSNTQLDWILIENEHTFFVDFEMPDERQKFELAQIRITVVGIVVGISGIAIPYIYGKVR